MSDSITPSQLRQNIRFPHDTPKDRARRKAAMVALGLDAMNHDQWLMVLAITTLIRRKGMSHD